MLDALLKSAFKDETMTSDYSTTSYSPKPSRSLSIDNQDTLSVKSADCIKSDPNAVSNAPSQPNLLTSTITTSSSNFHQPSSPVNSMDDFHQPTSPVDSIDMKSTKSTRSMSNSKCSKTDSVASKQQEQEQETKKQLTIRPSQSSPTFLDSASMDSFDPQQPFTALIMPEIDNDSYQSVELTNKDKYLVFLPRDDRSEAELPGIIDVSTIQDEDETGIMHLTGTFSMDMGESTMGMANMSKCELDMPDLSLRNKSANNNTGLVSILHEDEEGGMSDVAEESDEDGSSAATGSTDGSSAILNIWNEDYEGNPDPETMNKLLTAKKLPRNLDPKIAYEIKRQKILRELEELDDEYSSDGSFNVVLKTYCYSKYICGDAGGDSEDEDNMSVGNKSNTEASIDLDDLIHKRPKRSQYGLVPDGQYKPGVAQKELVLMLPKDVKPNPMNQSDTSYLPVGIPKNSKKEEEALNSGESKEQGMEITLQNYDSAPHRIAKLVMEGKVSEGLNGNLDSPQSSDSSPYNSPLNTTIVVTNKIDLDRFVIPLKRMPHDDDYIEGDRSIASEDTFMKEEAVMKKYANDDNTETPNDEALVVYDDRALKASSEDSKQLMLVETSSSALPGTEQVVQRMRSSSPLVFNDTDKYQISEDIADDESEISNDWDSTAPELLSPTMNLSDDIEEAISVTNHADIESTPTDEGGLAIGQKDDSTLLVDNDDGSVAREADDMDEVSDTEAVVNGGDSDDEDSDVEGNSDETPAECDGDQEEVTETGTLPEKDQTDVDLESTVEAVVNGGDSDDEDSDVVGNSNETLAECDGDQEELTENGISLPEKDHTDVDLESKVSESGIDNAARDSESESTDKGDDSDEAPKIEVDSQMTLAERDETIEKQDEVMEESPLPMEDNEANAPDMECRLDNAARDSESDGTEKGDDSDEAPKIEVDSHLTLAERDETIEQQGDIETLKDDGLISPDIAADEDIFAEEQVTNVDDDAIDADELVAEEVSNTNVIPDDGVQTTECDKESAEKQDISPNMNMDLESSESGHTSDGDDIDTEIEVDSHETSAAPVAFEAKKEDTLQDESDTGVKSSVGEVLSKDTDEIESLYLVIGDDVEAESRPSEKEVINHVTWGVESLSMPSDEARNTSAPNYDNTEEPLAANESVEVSNLSEGLKSEEQLEDYSPQNNESHVIALRDEEILDDDSFGEEDVCNILDVTLEEAEDIVDNEKEVNSHVGEAVPSPIQQRENLAHENKQESGLPNIDDDNQPQSFFCDAVRAAPEKILDDLEDSQISKSLMSEVDKRCRDGILEVTLEEEHPKYRKYGLADGTPEKSTINMSSLLDLTYGSSKSESCEDASSIKKGDSLKENDGCSTDQCALLTSASSGEGNDSKGLSVLQELQQLKKTMNRGHGAAKHVRRNPSLETAMSSGSTSLGRSDHDVGFREKVGTKATGTIWGDSSIVNEIIAEAGSSKKTTADYAAAIKSSKSPSSRSNPRSSITDMSQKKSEIVNRLISSRKAYENKSKDTSILGERVLQEGNKKVEP